MRMTKTTDNYNGAFRFSKYAQQIRVETITATLETLLGVKTNSLHGYKSITLDRVFALLPLLKGNALVNGAMVTNVTTRRNGRHTVRTVYFTYTTRKGERIYFAMVFGAIVESLKGFERCGIFSRYNATLFARINEK
jgi:hypothetical protein